MEKRRNALLSQVEALHVDWKAFAEKRCLPVPKTDKSVRQGWTSDATGTERLALVDEMSALVRRTEGALDAARKECRPDGPSPDWFSQIVDQLQPYIVVASSLNK